MQLIKNYSKNDGVKSGVTVGVIGFPNVGKSSIINSLKKSRAAGVSANAGFTTSLQRVDIDSKVKIIDSPGVILTNEDEVTLVLRNQVNASEVKDPIKPIEEILRRSNKEKLLMHYKMADFTNPT
jgi:nuclear GTP-binding protein